MSPNQFQQRIIELFNEEVTRAGLDSLAIDTQLTQAANLNTDEMVQANFFTDRLSGEVSDDIEGNFENSLDNDSADGNIAGEESSLGNNSADSNITGEESSSGNDSANGNTAGNDGANGNTAGNDGANGNTAGEESSLGNNSANGNITGEESSAGNDSANGNITGEESSAGNDGANGNTAGNDGANGNTAGNDGANGNTVGNDSADGNITGEESSLGNDSAGSPTDVFDRPILDLVNQERAKVGADPLKINQQLDDAADLHSQDQANMNLDFATHTGSNGSSVVDRVNATGYEWSNVAENAALGQLDPEEVMFGIQGDSDNNGWMGSSGHRANILNSDLEEIGVGYAESSDGTPYWTQVFGADFA